MISTAGSILSLASFAAMVSEINALEAMAIASRVGISSTITTQGRLRCTQHVEAPHGPDWPVSSRTSFAAPHYRFHPGP